VHASSDWGATTGAGWETGGGRGGGSGSGVLFAGPQVALSSAAGGSCDVPGRPDIGGAGSCFVSLCTSWSALRFRSLGVPKNGRASPEPSMKIAAMGHGAVALATATCASASARSTAFSSSGIAALFLPPRSMLTGVGGVDMLQRMRVNRSAEGSPMWLRAAESPALGARPARPGGGAAQRGAKRRNIPQISAFITKFPAS